MTHSDESGVTVKRPAHWVAGVIVCSPHSGCDYPAWFLRESNLPANILRSSEDAFIDRLIAPAVGSGAVTLSTSVPRCLVDVNRAPHEIDPQVVAGAPRRPLNSRTMAGLGVIPRVVAHGRIIHRQPVPYAEAQRRIDTHWRPYHAALRSLIDEAQSTFGHAVVIDMHSMPHDALRHLLPPKPDVVLGNRFGASASDAVTELVTGVIRQTGLTVRLNSPFAGAYVATAYGRPGAGVHVLQMEIDRRLYMDEARISPADGFDMFAARLARILHELARIEPGGIRRIAAE